MSISPSDKYCPTCDSQTLDAISAVPGNWLHCPVCGGIFIHEDLILSLSQNREATQAIINEAKGVMIPAERECPQCSQKMFDCSARSRGLIYTICTNCRSFWSSLSALGLLDGAVEMALRAP